MPASNPIAPKGGYNHVQFDYFTPLTALQETQVLTAPAGTQYIGFDPNNLALKLNEIRNLGSVELVLRNTAAAPIGLYTNNTRRMRLEQGTAQLLLDPASAQFLISTSTSDASDNAKILIASGGAASTSRGAYLDLRGNEQASNGGSIFLQSGDINTATLQYVATNAAGQHLFYVGGTEIVRIDTNGLDIRTGGSTSISTGTGSVKMTSANNANNAAWIPIRYNGTTYYVPGWTAHNP